MGRALVRTLGLYRKPMQIRTTKHQLEQQQTICTINVLYIGQWDIRYQSDLVFCIYARCVCFLHPQWSHGVTDKLCIVSADKI
jgi:hypothetical protein